jgi:hypothetical protein
MSESEFRFFDNREKYLLFTTTCSENRATARRIGEEFQFIEPAPPALRLYQAGSGEGTLLNLTLRHLHSRWPTLPFLVVVRELDADILRLAVRNIADRFHEHPELVLVFTNTPYHDATRLPADNSRDSAQSWQVKELTGQSSHAFERQINEAIDFVQNRWPTDPRHPERTAGIVLFRHDQRFILDAVLPQPSQPIDAFDLVIASQAYRSRLSVEQKINWVLEPLARSLTGRFRAGAADTSGASGTGEMAPGLYCADLPPDGSEFSFELQLNPDDVSSSIGTSTLLAAWNAAAYVAQIDEPRLTQAMSESSYLNSTRKVLTDHGGLWFRNECFVIARPQS